MKPVDLNCDMGESFGIYKLGLDEEVIKYISSANIACGFHAGDPVVMAKTVRLAKEHGVNVGAHPGYPDLVGFGRRVMHVDREELKQSLIYQIGALQAIAESQGVQLKHVKPHGALNNQAATDLDLARTIAEAIAAVSEDLIFIAMAGTAMCQAAEEFGLTVAREAFADRAYNDDGTLVSRKQPGAVIHDPDQVLERVQRMVNDGVVISINGKELPVEVDTICVHGDTKEAVAMVRKLSEGLQVRPLGSK
ncbi:MAG: LamB/YcsF family protein [Thermoanaerobacteraceae bacterium]|nr:LamB/YcsF family protein [Thermoanaerobacteraceae bacterium]